MRPCAVRECTALRNRLPVRRLKRISANFCDFLFIPSEMKEVKNNLGKFVKDF